MGTASAVHVQFRVSTSEQMTNPIDSDTQTTVRDDGPCSGSTYSYHATMEVTGLQPDTRYYEVLVNGTVVGDIGRKATEADPQLQEFLDRAEKLLAQQRKSKNKLYSIDAPEVECISKGKTHKPYEFGCKVGVATTNESNWVVGVQALHGNPYDGHTLPGAIEQVERVTGKSVKEAFADKGYRGHTPNLQSHKYRLFQGRRYKVLKLTYGPFESL